jgi:hypothetical protein
VTVYPDPMAAAGQRYASPDASTCEARLGAYASLYSRMLVSLRFPDRDSERSIRPPKSVGASSFRSCSESVLRVSARGRSLRMCVVWFFR